MTDPAASPENRHPPRTANRSSALTVALSGIVLVLLWLTITVNVNFNGNWTALFCTGTPMPPELEQREDIYRFHGSDGYDGQYFHIQAHDPVPAEWVRAVR